MRFVKGAANFVLGLLAIVGLLSVGLWVANKMQVLQPLVVVSGSMSPHINTGDLVFGTATPVEDLQPGQVASLVGVQNKQYVTHRVTAVERLGDQVVVEMKGDANRVEDPYPYERVAGDIAWTPTVVISGGGYVVAKLLQPAVLFPALVGVLALIGLTMLPSSKPERSGARHGNRGGFKSRFRFKSGAGRGHLDRELLRP